MKPVGLLVLACVPAACTVGVNSTTFLPAHTPAGIEVTVTVRHHGAVQGELLVLDDTSLIVLLGRRVTMVPARQVRWFRVRQILSPGLQVAADRFATGRSFDQVRLASRFPRGLSPERLGALLHAYDQDELDILPR